MGTKAKKNLNAIDLLILQHREVDEIFSELEESTDPEEKEALFADLADKLAVHARIEEQHFYPAVNAKKTEDMILEAFVEHTSIKRLLADLLAADSSDPTFDAQIKVLQEQIEHHVEEEEEELFPAAKKVLNEVELVALAQEMTSTQTQLEEGEPRKLIPQEVAAASPPTSPQPRT